MSIPIVFVLRYNIILVALLFFAPSSCVTVFGYLPPLCLHCGRNNRVFSNVVAILSRY